MEEIIKKMKKYGFYQHSCNVAHLADQICREAEMDQKETKEIVMAAFFHDIGKLKIPKEILEKPGKLTREEWGVIKTHCAWGKKIALSMGLSNSVAEIILLHHERQDGSGYPLGLRDIPVGARIIAVCDSADAIMEKRAYKEAKSKEECMEEIRKNRGILFEPWVVDLFLRILEEKKILHDDF